MRSEHGKRLARSWLLVFGLAVGGGCSARDPFDGDVKLDRIEAQLNDPKKLSYWDYEGDVSVDAWERIRSHFTKQPFVGQLADWQSLAVLELSTTQGGQWLIEVYDTGKTPGCYKVNDTYYELTSEEKFVEALREAIGEKSARQP